MSVTLHTSLGDLKVELFCDSTPKTCYNFLALCASGYYDNSIIHRVIKGFIVQMGDPSGTGKGGKSIWDDKFEDEIRPHLRHNMRGIVSMANNGPGTNGSQFFITFAKQPHLDGKNTVFGKVIHGSDTTLEDLERLEVGGKYRPKQETYLQSITIHANPLANN